jgi:EAL domain-containing protein (putative c-di-GMP-specific phosphodiesterase class I)
MGLGGWADMNETNLQDILGGSLQAVTYAHPIVGLKDGDTKAQEMLTRFPGPDGRMKSVGELLEDLTLSPELRVRLDLLCLGAVFDALARHPITEHLLFLNLCPATLEHPEFWNRIQPWLWDLPIPPHRIVLEITESCSMHDLDQMEGFARRLRDIGVRIAVDDLGSGIASLSHMARLAPDFIKVDRSLVKDVQRHPYQAALLNALALFAERMRVGYIVEGIETTEELQAIIDADVPWGQGFIFGHPEPLRLPQARA